LGVEGSAENPERALYSALRRDGCAEISCLDRICQTRERRLGISLVHMEVDTRICTKVLTDGSLGRIDRSPSGSWSRHGALARRYALRFVVRARIFAA